MTSSLNGYHLLQPDLLRWQELPPGRGVSGVCVHASANPAKASKRSFGTMSSHDLLMPGFLFNFKMQVFAKDSVTFLAPLLGHSR